MKSTFLLLIFCAVSHAKVSAQEYQLTAPDGKRVNLYSDGTWKFSTSDRFIDSTHYDCDNLTIIDVDRMTGDTSINANQFIKIFKKSGDVAFTIYYLYMANNKTCCMNIEVEGGGQCIEKESKIQFLFTDHSKLETYHNSPFNCNGSCNILFGDLFQEHNKLLGYLKSKKIEAIRVFTSSSFVEEDIDSASRDLLFETAACVFKGMN